MEKGLVLSVFGNNKVAANMLKLQVIMATNKIESLDPALIRPGRIDRKIEFPLPDTKTKRRIFGIHTGRMTLAEDVNLEEFIMAKVRNQLSSPLENLVQC